MSMWELIVEMTGEFLETSMGSLVAAGISFAVSVGMAFLAIPLLRRLKLGQEILEDGPSWHQSKQGTPTVGGLIFMIGITLAAIAAALFEVDWYGFQYSWFPVDIYLSGEYDLGVVFAVLGIAWIFGLIGLTDDLSKIRKKENKGLKAMEKLLLQMAASAAFLAYLRYIEVISESIYIPFIHTSIYIPWLVYIFAGILVMAGFINAVNLTDGIDGLCAGVTLPIALFAMWWYTDPYMETSIISGALAGGMIAFLIFNFHPAKVFMGDTGSLFIGGLLCGIAFVSSDPLVLMLVGLVFIVEMLSVMIQVFYFKKTKGKRLFKMAPFHHHLEKSGWGEKKIVFAAAGITALLCATFFVNILMRVLSQINLSEIS
ncbi:MAG: phospho-N-acetylmuramoyl-pentapeptide-transferase [Oscillospiraceae bacterium]|nr:phospho-N-acetylmuramoyl-pentapeptide-transferase [Oscillospiraceae bacterium]